MVKTCHEKPGFWEVKDQIQALENKADNMGLTKLGIGLSGVRYILEGMAEEADPSLEYRNPLEVFVEALHHAPSEFVLESGKTHLALRALVL